MFDTPDAAFRTAIAAVNAEDWLGTAAACDPASLATFKRSLLDQFDRAEPEFTLTFEEYNRHTRDMPLEVAEYHYAQHRAASDPRRQFREEMPGLGELDDLKRLDPASVFASWLEARSYRKQVERLLKDAHISAATASRALEHIPTELGYQPIGVVHDGERIAHVLFHHVIHEPEEWELHSDAWLGRMPAEEQELARDLVNHEHPAVSTCRRQVDGTWRLIASRAFLMLGSITLHPATDFPDEQQDDPAG